jgi:hypothetical protein
MGDEALEGNQLVNAIRLEIPGDGIQEKKLQWEGSSAVRIGEILGGSVTTEMIDALDKRAEDFDKWLKDPTARAQFTTTLVTENAIIEDGDTTTDSITGWTIALIPIERGLRGKEYQDAELFLKAQKNC